MTVIIAWSVGVAVNLSLLALLAWTQSYYLHLVIAAAIPTAIVQSLYQSPPGLGTASRDPVGKATDALRHIAGVWSWGALALIVIYASSILTWREYGRFVIVFTMLASASLVLATQISKAASTPDGGAKLLGAIRVGAIMVGVALAIVAVGLIIHDGRAFRLGGKVINGQLPVTQRDGWQDWAASHIFFYGAIAVSALSWKIVRDLRTAVR